MRRDHPARISRRQVLIGAGLGIAGCAGNGPAGPSCVAPSDGPGLAICLVGTEKLTLPRGALLAVGQAMIMAADDNNAAIVARDTRGFYALSATCRHQCCTVTICDGACNQPIVSPNDCAAPRTATLATSGPAFLCPCHGSTYGASGAVISGPSLQPLAAVAMSIMGMDVVVDLARAAAAGDRVTS
jgi:Rieske Fe-S protein